MSNLNKEEGINFVVLALMSVIAPQMRGEVRTVGTVTQRVKRLVNIFIEAEKQGRVMITELQILAGILQATDFISAEVELFIISRDEMGWMVCEALEKFVASGRSHITDGMVSEVAAAAHFQGRLKFFRHLHKFFKVL